MLVTASALAYFVAIGSTLTVLPVFVEADLGGNSAEVGLSVGVFGISAAVLRPILGSIGDRRGRRFVLTVGGTIAGLGMLALVPAQSLAAVIGARLITGVGEAFTFVGAAAAAQDLAPEHRRGEAASYFSVAVYGGLAIGPVLGDWVADTYGVDAVWFVAAGMCALMVLLAQVAPGATPEMDAIPRPSTVLHRAALRPGVLLGTVLMAQSGFIAFIELHSEEVGVGIGGLAFLVFAGVVLALRLLAARVPDRVDTVVLVRAAAVASATGLAIIGLWVSPAGIVVGTVVHAFGQAFLFPALFLVVLEGASPTSRSHAIATFSMFFDIATGAGGLLLGVVAWAVGAETGAFLAGAALCLTAAFMAGPLIARARATA